MWIRLALILFTISIYSSVIKSVSAIISNKYMTFYTPNYAKRYIYLEGKYSYSVQLILEKDQNSKSTDRRKTNPVFIVKAPEFSYYGVMAIIQSIHLRTDSNGNCKDYLQFSPQHEGGNETIIMSSKICGTLRRGESWDNPYLIGPRTYFNPKGSIKLQVHVDPETKNEMDIGAEIVFTAYTTCPGTETGLKTLQGCSLVETMSCIPSALFCDSKIDCGFQQGFATDETYCYLPYLYGLIAVIIIAIVVISIYVFMHWAHMKVKRDSIPVAN